MAISRRGGRYLIVAVLLVMLLGVAPNVMASTVIKFLIPDWANPAQYVIEMLIEDFESKNPDITVEIAAWKSVENIIMSVLADAPYDVVSLGGFVGELASNDILLPLDDRIAASNLTAVLNAEAFEFFRYYGQTLGVPAMNFLPMASLVYNRDFFDESGIPPLDRDRSLSWEEVRALNQKLTLQDPNGRLTRVGWYPVEARNDRMDIMEALLGMPVIDFENGQVLIDQPAYVELFSSFDTLIQDMGREKVAEFFGGWSTRWWSLTRGETAMANYSGLLEEINKRATWNFDVTWHPSSDGTKAYVLGGWGVGIPVNARHPEEAWRFIEYLATDLQAQVILYQEQGLMNVASSEFIAWVSTELQQDPRKQWEVQAMVEAQRVMIARPHPNSEAIGKVWTDAKTRIYQGLMPPEAVLQIAADMLSNMLYE